MHMAQTLECASSIGSCLTVSNPMTWEPLRAISMEVKRGVGLKSGAVVTNEATKDFIDGVNSIVSGLRSWHFSGEKGGAYLISQHSGRVLRTLLYRTKFATALQNIVAGAICYTCDIVCSAFFTIFPGMCRTWYLSEYLPGCNYFPVNLKMEMKFLENIAYNLYTFPVLWSHSYDPGICHFSANLVRQNNSYKDFLLVSEEWRSLTFINVP